MYRLIFIYYFLVQYPMFFWSSINYFWSTIFWNVTIPSIFWCISGVLLFGILWFQPFFGVSLMFYCLESCGFNHFLVFLNEVYSAVACGTLRSPKGFHKEVSDQHSCQVLCSLNTQATDNLASRLCPHTSN